MSWPSDPPKSKKARRCAPVSKVSHTEKTKQFPLLSAVAIHSYTGCDVDAFSSVDVDRNFSHYSY